MNILFRAASFSGQKQHWVLVGAVLALALLVALVAVLRGNVAQAQSARNQAELQSRERARCNVLPNRREREQCLLARRLGDEVRTRIAEQ